MLIVIWRTNCKWLAWQNIKTRNLHNRIESYWAVGVCWELGRTRPFIRARRCSLQQLDCGGSKISTLNFWQELLCFRQVKSVNSCSGYQLDPRRQLAWLDNLPVWFQSLSGLKFARVAECVAHFIFQTLCITDLGCTNESYCITLHVSSTRRFLSQMRVSIQDFEEQTIAIGFACAMGKPYAMQRMKLKLLMSGLEAFGWLCYASYFAEVSCSAAKPLPHSKYSKYSQSSLWSAPLRSSVSGTASLAVNVLPEVRQLVISDSFVRFSCWNMSFLI